MGLWKNAKPKTGEEPKGLTRGRQRAERANSEEEKLLARLERGEKLSRGELKKLGLKQGKLDPP